MEYIYYVMISVCVLALFTTVVHIHNNTVLDKYSKHWFCAALLIISVAAICEGFCTLFEYMHVYVFIHPILTATEFSFCAFFPVALAFACKIKKPARVMACVEGAHALAEYLLVGSGLVFYISEDGAYHRGKYYLVYLISYILAYVFLALVMILVSRSFKNRDLRTILMVTVTALTGLIPSAINSNIRTAFLGASLLGILLYIYYEDLAEQDTQAKVRAHSEYMNRELIQTLSYALEAKDEYTKGHSLRVAEYTSVIARQMNFSEEALAKLHFAATLHDIGKIGIPDTVLNKPGRLTEDEYNIIKMHPVIGADILKNVEAIAYTSIVARYHHERYDGKGYPEGLRGKDIPLEARIVALADTFDAMTSKRIYRQKGFTDDQLRSEFIKNKGLQFDPEITDFFLYAFDKGLLDDIRVPYEQTDVSEMEFTLQNAKTELDTALRKILPDGNDDNLTIDEVIHVIEKLGKYDGALSAETTEFTRLFTYITNICQRYKHSCYGVLITLDADDPSYLTEADMNSAMEAIDLSVRQTIRTTDICTRFSITKYLIVLVEAGESNVNDIMKRIFNTYYKIQGRTNIVPKYEFGKVDEENVSSN